MTIVGTRRMIIYDDLQTHEKIRVYDVRVERPPHYDTFAEFHYSYHYGDSYIPYLSRKNRSKRNVSISLIACRMGPCRSVEARPDWKWSGYLKPLPIRWRKMARRWIFRRASRRTSGFEGVPQSLRSPADRPA